MFRVLHVLIVGLVALYIAPGAAPLPAASVAPSSPLTDTTQRGRPNPTLAVGKLLVADRNLSDSHFFETVVLLIEIDKDGAVGLVLNRRSTIPLQRLFPNLPGSPAADGLTFAGGPVAPTVVHALSSTPRSEGLRVVDGVYLMTSREELDAALATGAGSDDLRVYVGYAGW